MEKKVKQTYEAPSATTIALEQEAMICISGNSGTETVGISSSSYSDSDFE